MSEKQPSEYLKRTCLICGCHTNQTINIYEPRSGPNIVKLIQAKFKFQPLNEDKYLCFSCNNWLINWHSLQALNSNDAESPSGTFRSNVSNQVVHEKDEAPAGEQRLPAAVGHERRTAVVRPVAQVRPRQLVAASAVPVAVDGVKEHGRDRRNYSKAAYRTKQLLCRLPQRAHKSLQSCCMCDRAIVVRVRVCAALVQPGASSAKCRKCREVCKWRARVAQRRSAPKAGRRKRLLRLRLKTRPTMPMAVAVAAPTVAVPPRAAPTEQQQQLLYKHLVKMELNARNPTNQSQSLSRNPQQQPQQQQPQSLPQSPSHQQQCQAPRERQFLKRPLIDGKVVSMLRRLGTTLSRESEAGRLLPPIMTPVQERPRWTRQLDDDEILLDFNTAISEVLPRITADVVAPQPLQPPPAISRRATRRPAYRMSMETAIDTHEAVIDLSVDEVAAPPQHIYKLLPKGLSVSVISH